MEYGYDRPELLREGMVYAPKGVVPEEILKSKSYSGLFAHSNHDKITELCRACGWNSKHELYAGYDPRVKIFYTRNNMGLWKLGRRWMLRDQPNDGTLGNDFMTQQFIRSQPNLKIPLIKEMRLLSEPGDQIQFTLMSQAQGVGLDQLWPTLSREERVRYALQLGDVIKSLRQCRAPKPQKVNGDPLDDILVAVCNRLQPPTCMQVGATNDEWFDNMAPELRHGLAKIHRTRDPKVIEEKLQQLKENFPPSAPYVLTHGDFNLTNVIVKDGQLEAIIDWEMAGYHPWWVEIQRMRYHWPVDEDDPRDEVFQAVWKRVDPDFDFDKFYAEIVPKIFDVNEAWHRCDIDHPERASAWLRPDFCECKHFAGRLESTDLGKPTGHQIRNPDPTLMALGRSTSRSTN